MVAQQITKRAARTYSDALSTCIVMLGDGGTCHFVVHTSEVSRRPIDRGFDSSPIAVIDERGSQGDPVILTSLFSAAMGIDTPDRQILE